MQNTTNYNLNKPEAGDPIRVTDFNRNSDIIDAALKNLNTAVGTKAEQSAVNALTTAVASAGNCKIATGSYIGDGTYGADNPRTLNFDFKPRVVWIRCTNGNGTGVSYFDLLGFEGMTTIFIYNSRSGGTESTIYMTWGERDFTWYGNDSGYKALNNQGTKYYYLVLG